MNIRIHISSAPPNRTGASTWLLLTNIQRSRTWMTMLLLRSRTLRTREGGGTKQTSPTLFPSKKRSFSWPQLSSSLTPRPRIADEENFAFYDRTATKPGEASLLVTMFPAPCNALPEYPPEVHGGRPSLRFRSMSRAWGGKAVLEALHREPAARLRRCAAARQTC